MDKNPSIFQLRYSTIDPYVDDLIQILDALNVNRCAFIAHSAFAMVGILASTHCPYRFTKLVLFGASPRYVNDNGYNGRIEILDMVHVFQAMELNYRAWVYGFTSQANGANMPEAIQDFTQTLYEMARDLSVPLSSAEYLRQHLGRRTTLENLKTKGHLPYLTAPVLLSPAIWRALRRP
ncbi:hypothetical protein EZV62_027983 [Acer yangbiense]|uniref:AB hydrolase-1 domain-containing protein n=1 Tax=Acer yangbiense TaxID=1000413 RepID=A0A5C7GPU5_9ROSI|nr:hypothetical protein EZV62_027983 [Acer yangbiense]